MVWNGANYPQEYIVELPEACFKCDEAVLDDDDWEETEDEERAYLYHARCAPKN